MERLQKVIYLIEENPLVSEFEDVEKILKSIPISSNTFVM